MVGENITCTYVCKAGFIYYDGTTSKEYNCSGANKWFPTANPEDCLCKYFNVVISIQLAEFKTPVTFLKKRLTVDRFEGKWDSSGSWYM